MSTDDDLEKAQDAGIESVETRALLEEAVRGVRRIDRRMESDEGSQIARDQAIIDMQRRMAALEERRQQDALEDAGRILREKAIAEREKAAAEREQAAERRAAARAAENKEKRFQALAMLVAALLGIAARFALGGHHP